MPRSSCPVFCPRPVKVWPTSGQRKAPWWPPCPMPQWMPIWSSVMTSRRQCLTGHRSWRAVERLSRLHQPVSRTVSKQSLKVSRSRNSSRLKRLVGLKLRLHTCNHAYCEIVLMNAQPFPGAAVVSCTTDGQLKITNPFKVYYLVFDGYCKNMLIIIHCRWIISRTVDLNSRYDSITGRYYSKYFYFVIFGLFFGLLFFHNNGQWLQSCGLREYSAPDVLQCVLDGENIMSLHSRHVQWWADGSNVTTTTAMCRAQVTSMHYRYDYGCVVGFGWVTLSWTNQLSNCLIHVYCHLKLAPLCS